MLSNCSGRNICILSASLFYTSAVSRLFSHFPSRCPVLQSFRVLELEDPSSKYGFTARSRTPSKSSSMTQCRSSPVCRKSGQAFTSSRWTGNSVEPSSGVDKRMSTPKTSNAFGAVFDSVQERYNPFSYASFTKYITSRRPLTEK